MTRASSVVIPYPIPSNAIIPGINSNRMCLAHFKHILLELLQHCVVATPHGSKLSGKQGNTSSLHLLPSTSTYMCYKCQYLYHRFNMQSMIRLTLNAVMAGNSRQTVDAKILAHCTRFGKVHRSLVRPSAAQNLPNLSRAQMKRKAMKLEKAHDGRISAGIRIEKGGHTLVELSYGGLHDRSWTSPNPTYGVNRYLVVIPSPRR